MTALAPSPEPPAVATPHDYVNMRDYTTALATVQLLTTNEDPPHAFGLQVLSRVTARLNEKLDVHLFGSGHHPDGRPLPTARISAQRLNLLARELQTAGRELLIAADELKAKGALLLVVDRARQRGRNALAEAAVHLYG